MADSTSHKHLFLHKTPPARSPGAPSIIHHRALSLDTSPREGRRCRCAACGHEDTCTPRTDFRPRVRGQELYCIRCFTQGE